MTKTKRKICNVLVELGVEEIPARFMTSILADLKEKTEEKLQQARIGYENVKTFGTARRLVLYVSDISPKQSTVLNEVKGPPKEFAFDAQGNPTKAALGFARAQGAEVKDLFIREADGKEYVFVKITRHGQNSQLVLKEVLPEIFNSLYMPISMKWGDGDFQFIRPIHWILAICGKSNIPFSFGGISSSKYTYTHRFLGNKPVLVKIESGIDIEKYKKLLAHKGVVLDQENRLQAIKTQTFLLGQKYGATLIENDLLEEVTFLVENPVSLIGNFNPSFLDIPSIVLITSMKKHLKFFPVLDSRKEMTNNFVVVSDGVERKYFNNLKEGSQRVLEARLNDAAFFFGEDRKTSLIDRIKNLNSIAFYGGLGNLFDKKERIKSLALRLATHFGFSKEICISIERVADLCKADLSTQMVFEFTELQGLIGKEYALLSGEKEEVAEAIAEHYLPRFVGDKLPKTQSGIVTALADKIDTIVGCFSLGLIPSGSADPYGLRRQAQGLVLITIEEKLNYSLKEIIRYSFSLFKKLLDKATTKDSKPYKINYAQVEKDVLQFIVARIKNILLETGIKYDVAESAMAVFDNILATIDKAKIIMKIYNEDVFKGVVLTADRVARIASNQSDIKVTIEDFIEPQEKELYDLFIRVQASVSERVAKGHWEGAIKELSRLTNPVNDFFEKIMVMHEDPKIKRNRLALLSNLNNLYFLIADFQKIVA